MSLPDGLIALPGSSRANKTGSWRTFRPVVDEEKCIACSTCVPFCPEGIIVVTREDKYRTDYDFCKGCGICAQVCPVQALRMEREVR